MNYEIVLGILLSLCRTCGIIWPADQTQSAKEFSLASRDDKAAFIIKSLIGFYFLVNIAEKLM
jgi:hypothetical protein